MRESHQNATAFHLAQLQLTEPLQT